MCQPPAANRGELDDRTRHRDDADDEGGEGGEGGQEAADAEELEPGDDAVLAVGPALELESAASRPSRRHSRYWRTIGEPCRG
jgi:hypothetical protein